MLKMTTRTITAVFAFLSIGLPLWAKDKSKVSNIFDAAPAQVYDAVYLYAQHNGTIKWSDEKRFTLSGVIIVPGGNWDMQKHFDCTISVEPVEGGRKSAVDVLGTFPAKQQSLVGSFGEGPAVKVLKGIRAEFDRMPARALKNSETEQGKQDAKGEVGVPAGALLQQPTEGAKSDMATVTVKSTPAGCEISVDGKYVGDAPSIVRLTPGDHAISIGKIGFKTWQRTITLTPGGAVTITPVLDSEPIQVQQIH